MRPDEVRAHLKAEPFQPIRVHISDGASYDVPHPEFMIVTRATVAVAVDLADDGLAERLVYIDPIHITRITPIDGKKSTRRRKSSK